jgi:hypothetical protein
MIENAQWVADISEVSRCGGMAVMLPYFIEEQVTVWAFYRSAGRADGDLPSPCLRRFLHNQR